MTMSPERFRELLDVGTAGAPPAPLPVEDLAAGRGLLRRRRTVLASALAATVVMVGGVVGIGTGLGGDDHSVEPVAPHVPAGPSSAEVDQIVTACQELMPENLLRGPVHVVSISSSAFSVEAVFATTEGRYWAACSDPLLFEGVTPEVAAYDTQTRGSGFTGYSIGPACAEREGCRFFGVAFSDRRDPVVAAVQVELADGSSQTFDAPDGFIAVSAIGRLPEAGSFDVNGLVSGLSAGLAVIHQVTFLDASGAPLAADVFDGTGSGIGGRRVEGLPPLDHYPSLAARL